MSRISNRCVHGAGGRVPGKGNRLTVHALQREADAMCDGIRNRETRGTYRRSLREFIRFFRADKRFRFTVDDAARYKAYLVKKKRLSRASVSTYITALRRLCDHLVEKEVLTENPATTIRVRQPKRMHSGRALTDDEIERLESCMQGKGEIPMRDRAVLALMLRSGLSGTEIVRLNVGDLRKSDKGWSFSCGRREILVDDRRSVQMLDSYLEFRKASEGEKGTPVFLSAGNRTRGERMSTRGIRSALRVYFEQANISGDDVTPHALRYTAARLMSEAGASAEDLKLRLGLGTDQTARIYLHTIEAAQDK